MSAARLPLVATAIASAPAAAALAPAVTACRRVTHLIADKNGTLGLLAIEAAYLEGVAPKRAVEVRVARPHRTSAAPSGQYAIPTWIVMRGEKR